MFRTVLLTVTVLLSIFQYLLYRRWKARLAHRYPWIPGVFLFCICACNGYLGLYAFFGPAVAPDVLAGLWLPTYFFFLSWEYAFALSLPVWLGLTLAGCILILGYGLSRLLLRWWRDKAPVPFVNGERSEGARSPVFSRRMFLLGPTGAILDALPVIGAGAGFSGMFLGSKEILVLRRSISIPGLHRDLQGLRVVQISDLHVGSLINESYLRIAGGLIRDLRPDLVVVTGDTIDNNNRYLPVAGVFLRGVLEQSRGGVLLVAGNHDYIDDGDRAMAFFARMGITVLRNETRPFRRGSGVLNIMGLDYPHVEGRMVWTGRMEASQGFYREACSGLRTDDPLIVLNHHPGDFEYLKHESLALVLSGHTHGGQVRFSSDRESPLSLGSNVLKYYVDYYSENGRQLYVNRGLGHWFPLRVHCPPEITEITLF